MFNRIDGKVLKIIVICSENASTACAYNKNYLFIETNCFKYEEFIWIFSIKTGSMQGHRGIFALK